MPRLKNWIISTTTSSRSLPAAPWREASGMSRKAKYGGPIFLDQPDPVRAFEGL